MKKIPPPSSPPPAPYLLTCIACNRLNQGYGTPPAKCVYCGVPLEYTKGGVG